MGKTLHGLAKEFDLGVAGEDVSTYRNAYPGVAWFDVEIPRKIRPLRDLGALIELCVLCHRLRPDVVHSIMPKAGLLGALAAWLTRVPVRIHTFTGQVWDTKSGWSRRLYKAMDRLIVSLNTVCLTDSRSQSARLCDEGICIEGQPLPVLGHGSLVGVDLERFDRSRITARATVTRPALGLTEEDFVIAYIARKTRDKGATDMLRGFELARQRNPRMRLLFIGPDESEGEIEELRQASPKLFESVIERGPVANHEEYLLISDVLCLPSYREGFGSVVLDAAALNVPTVGSRIVGLVDSISDGSTGLLFPAGDVEEMAHVLCRLCADRRLVQRLGLEARRRVEAYFSSEVMTGLLATFYRERVGE